MLLAAQCFSFHGATQTVESATNQVKIGRSFFLSRFSFPCAHAGHGNESVWCAKRGCRPWDNLFKKRIARYSNIFDSSGTFSSSYFSISTPMTSINEAKGWFSFSPTVSIKLSSTATSRLYSLSACGTNRTGANADHAFPAFFTSDNITHSFHLPSSYSPCVSTLRM